MENKPVVQNTDVVPVEKQVNREQQMLQTLVDSRALPAYIKNYATAFAFNQFGKELGFQPMQAFHYLVMINGKISLTVMAMEAMLLKNNITIEKIFDGEYLYKDGTMAYGNYYEVERGKPVDRITECRLTRTFPNGQVISQTTRFTFLDAKDAELLDKDNWKKWRRDMLWSRCLSRASRRIAADIFSGLHTADELVDSTNSSENYKRDSNGYINIEMGETDPVTDEIDDELSNLDESTTNFEDVT